MIWATCRRRAAPTYARANIAGQNFDSAIINGHDSLVPGLLPLHVAEARAGGRDLRRACGDVTVEVRTGNRRGAGTNDDVFLRLGPNLRFPLDKRSYDDFERDDTDTYSVPIDAVTRAA